MPGLAIDVGLLARFRDAGAMIAWRAGPKAPKRPRGRRVRVAHLNDEEARVESWGTDAAGGVEVESGPVGALVLLLEADRRGFPRTLEPVEAGADPAFPGGAIRALWYRTAAGPGASPLALQDLVNLARYALA
jgi:hypothetical protein